MAENTDGSCDGCIMFKEDNGWCFIVNIIG